MPFVGRMAIQYALNAGAEQAVNVVHFLDPDGTPDDLAGFNTKYVANIGAWWDLIQPVLRTSTSVAAVTLSSIDPDDGSIIQSFAALPPAGTGERTEDQLPLQCAVVVSFRTTSASVRGRIYMPAHTEAHNEALGSFLLAGREAYANAWGGFFSGMNNDPGGLTPVVMSRQGGTPSFVTITSGDVGSVVDTQRRRRGDLVEARTTFDVT